MVIGSPWAQIGEDPLVFAVKSERPIDQEVLERAIVYRERVVEAYRAELTDLRRALWKMSGQRP